MDVVTVGEALVCLAPVVGLMGEAPSYRYSIGGAELNTSIGLARLGDAVAWASALGDDPFGDSVVRLLEAEGVDTSLVRRSDAGPTALMVKDRPDAHTARVRYYRAGSAASRLLPSELDRSVVAGARAVHVTGINAAIGDGNYELALRTLRIARENGAIASFDPNHRPALIDEGAARSRYAALAALATDILCNEAEAMLMTGTTDAASALDRLATTGAHAVVVKRGADGALAVIDGERIRVPAFPAPKPVDPVGAGDAFNAGWLHARLHGLPSSVGLGLAAFAAAQVVQHEGDYEGFPSFDAVEQWLAEYGSTPVQEDPR